MTVNQIRRDIYESLPILHRETVNLLVATGEWGIIENGDKIGPDVSVGPLRPVVGSDSGNNRCIRGVSP